jgi:hypothetical protein
VRRRIGMPLSLAEEWFELPGTRPPGGTINSPAAGHKTLCECSVSVGASYFSLKGISVTDGGGDVIGELQAASPPALRSSSGGLRSVRASKIGRIR